MILNTRTITALAATLALAGAAAAQFHLVQVSPSTPPDPIDATSNTIVSSSSTWSITSSHDGRTFKIDGKDGNVTAEIDGKPVPAERVVLEGDVVTIKDEKGETLFATLAPASGASGNVFTLTSPQGALFTSPRGLIAGPRTRIAHVAPAAPPVMIGVQLLEPDATLRGHLGLKENESTMIGAVYEGLPASNAGLEPYDIIVAIDGKSPASIEAVRAALRDTEAGKSISLKVIHRGQEKTVAITPEKYDGEKLDKAKVNAIAATSSPGSSTIAGSLDPDIDTWAKAWVGGNGSVNVQPFVATSPGKNGKPMTLWMNKVPGSAAPDMTDFARRMQEMAAQMQAQAEAARLDAERLREQLLQQRLGAGSPRGATQPGMDDRMKNMEDMLRKLMEEREKKSDGKSDARS